ncbi:SRPBCC domain-containing protein [Streptomyces sp. NBC_00249]|uniref:SRPBCC family protein n=1 Tax=Streptomyces sp. NBC_00249 TaxID=2975690 RepID=UPI00224D4678|nr:SRPBCC domain-containing protein [Streptomyces sp. NBC_00249]MCX5196048.1 SRPBCC domain-containing protein [Streptomyces sp. NBC_00249]
MEHQVFVPVPAEDLRAVLRDPGRVARCVPGLQHDADTASGPVAGRLKLRVGGHTVTYRGALTVTERAPDRFTAEGEGTEVRGSGAVTLSLGLRLLPHEGGTRLEFTGGATAEGRAAGFEPEATATAARRLLERLAANLATEARAPEKGPELDAAPDLGDPVAEAEEAEEAGASVFDTEVPPPSLDPFLEGDFAEIADIGAAGTAPRPPAEAAHARRTMIGRSAEEVDHAPPRGRYAPVPAPSSATAGANLRWIGPAAALALASAVVVGRALRRRR